MAKITMEGGGAGNSITGSGAFGEVAYFDGSSSIYSGSDFYWDTTERGIVIGALAPAPGTAVARIQAYGISDPAGSLLSLNTGTVWGSTPIMRLYEKGNLYLSSNAGADGLNKNIFIGANSIGANTVLDGTNNVAIGHETATAPAPGADITTGDHNILIGSGAGCNITSGSNNISIGSSSGKNISNGVANLTIGAAAGELYTGSNAVFLGLNSGKVATNGTDIVSVGNAALFALTSGSKNTAIGVTAGGGITNTSDNTFVGYNAGRYRASGTDANTNSIQGVYVGSGTKSVAAGGATNEIVIGYNAVGAGSNSVTLGHTTVTNTYLRGNINLVDGGNVVADTTTGTKIGTATTQKLALWNKTPIAQPTTAISGATISSPGAGNVIKTDDTFGGYTLAQVVQALINVGILQ
jgi:hypothetical protein